MEPKGTLAIGETHPAAQSAYRYIIDIPVVELLKHGEAFSSCAIEGNRLAEVCGETLERILNAKPVSDRYVLGLAWALKEMENE